MNRKLRFEIRSDVLTLLKDHSIREVMAETGLSMGHIYKVIRNARNRGLEVPDMRSYNRISAGELQTRPLACGHPATRENIQVYVARWKRADGTAAHGLARDCRECKKARKNKAVILRKNGDGKLPGNDVFKRCPVCQFIEPHVCVVGAGRADDRMVVDID